MKAVDEALDKNGLDEHILAQVGASSYRPRNFEAVPSLEKALFEKKFNEADSVISHAGVGSMMMAIESGKPLLVMPRLREHGEVVNNHQVAIARKLEEQGCVLVAYGPEDVQTKMEQLKTFVPRQRKPNPEAVAERISAFLSELSQV